MAQLWPWLAMAGLGGLHGLNPATGWMLAAAWGLRLQDRREALRALWPIGLGHLLSVLLVALLAIAGSRLDRSVLLYCVGGLLLACLAAHFWRHSPSAWRAPAGQVGVALWSFLMSGLHGAGLMVVPALLPLCVGAGQGSQSSLEAVLLALAAVAVHGGAMLLVTGLVALGVVNGGLVLAGRWKSPRMISGGGDAGGRGKGLCAAVRVCHSRGRRRWRRLLCAARGAGPRGRTYMDASHVASKLRCWLGGFIAVLYPAYWCDT